MGLEQLFYNSAEKYPDKEAVIFKDSRLTYSQLYEKMLGFAALLEKHTNKGDMVLITARNSARQIALILACFASGRIACPINWRMSSEDLATVIKGSNFRLAFYDECCESLYESAAAIAKPVGIFPCGLDSVTLPDSNEFIPREQNMDDIAIRYFTSGSTGTPQSVLHTHRSMYEYTLAYSKVSEWGADTIYQTQSNLFHLSGFSCFISLFVGGTLVLMDRYSEEEFFKTMERERCTRISLVPTLIAKCLGSGVFRKYDFSSVRKIVYGGSAMPFAQVKRTLNECNCMLEQAYGSTEACNITVLTGEEHIAAITGKIDKSKLESAGRPIPGVEIKIVDDDGNLVNEGLGEVAVKSKFLLAKVEGHIPHTFCLDGYYRTGDIGRLDSDGYLYLIDRKNDMIVSGGENIFPREVENCIAHMINDVAMTSVVGVPDPVWGEKVVAYVVRHKGSSVTGEEIINYCRDHIASYKKPREVIFVDRLPFNTNGKICRKILKEEYDSYKS